MGTPTFSRQRVILDLLRHAPKTPSKVQLLKWLFLIGEETDIRSHIPYYDFLPYQYGPFSFTVYQELARLQERGFVTATLEIPAAECRVVDESIARLKSRAREATREILGKYGGMAPNALLNSVYDRYEWFATRSQLRPACEHPECDPAVYTMGYEGVSIDAFLNRLLEAKIGRVIDVRKNAFSQKYGFTGGRLRKMCSKIGLDYQHLPGLGIPSELRIDLSTREKRQRLFARYRQEILPSQTEAQQRAVDLLRDRPSVLVCVEQRSEDCHRGTLALTLASQADLTVVHL